MINLPLVLNLFFSVQKLVLAGCSWVDGLMAAQAEAVRKYIRENPIPAGMGSQKEAPGKAPPKPKNNHNYNDYKCDCGWIIFASKAARYNFCPRCNIPLRKNTAPKQATTGNANVMKELSELREMLKESQEEKKILLESQASLTDLVKDLRRRESGEEIVIVDSHFHINRFHDIHSLDELKEMEMKPIKRYPFWGGLINYCDPGDFPNERAIKEILGSNDNFFIAGGIHPSVTRG